MFHKFWTVAFVAIWIVLVFCYALGLRGLVPMLVVATVMFSMSQSKYFIVPFIVLALIEDVVISYKFGTTAIIISIVCVCFNLINLLPFGHVVNAAIMTVVGCVMYFVLLGVLYYFTGSVQFDIFSMLRGWYNILFIVAINVVVSYFWNSWERKLKI